jgi:hypothetical protein
MVVHRLDHLTDASTISPPSWPSCARHPSTCTRQRNRSTRPLTETGLLIDIVGVYGDVSRYDADDSPHHRVVRRVQRHRDTHRRRGRDD